MPRKAAARSVSRAPLLLVQSDSVTTALADGPHHWDAADMGTFAMALRWRPTSIPESAQALAAAKAALLTRIRSRSIGELAFLREVYVHHILGAAMFWSAA
jgi:hypothetical protein